ncbi:MAG: amidohydrolase [Alphaproteobacteria bacterium]|nr:amidohydrolase [Alphaproteobacteria bacterium]
MAVKDEIARRHAELVALRHDIHAHPEIAFEEHRTAGVVADRLAAWGVEVHAGLAGTGVVGRLTAGSGNRAIALRADMDALPMQEANSFAHASRNVNRMHACGHDGHTTMLLGAAQYLAATKNFDGTVFFIFQPAEENEGGARVMIDEGLFRRFPVEAVFGMHNWPGMPVGEFAVQAGPMMAAADRFRLTVQGRGAHGAMPHQGIDPIVVGAAIVSALQTIVARNVNPVDAAVVSVTQFHGGDAYNIIPDTVELRGTLRSFREDVRQQIARSVEAIAKGIAAAHGATAEFTFVPGYPPTVNHVEETELAARAAATVAGDGKVARKVAPSMGSEDFAFMLQQVPGSYIWVGNGPGEGGCTLHNPHYDFNDEVIPVGASYWATLVEQVLARG